MQVQQLLLEPKLHSILIDLDQEHDVCVNTKSFSVDAGISKGLGTRGSRGQ